MPAVLDQYKDYRMFANTTEIKEYKPPKV